MKIAILSFWVVAFASTSMFAETIEKRQSCKDLFAQCGGQYYSGITCCTSGNVCVYQSNWYSQCRPQTVASTTTTTTTTTTKKPTTTTTTVPVTSPSPTKNGKNFKKPFPGSNPNYLWRNEGECTKPFIRKEWRKMTKANQKAYLDAVNCLNKKQAISTAAAPGARTRFDDFCGSHIRQSDNIHGVGHFLPWHRMYVAMFEEYLAAECGYTDGLPYWDWSLDSDPNTFAQSPIFASDAFGGNGPKLTGNPSSVGGLDIPNHTGGGCVQDGAFKDMVVSLGPGASLTANPRCLSRDLVPRLAINFQQSRIDKIMASTSFVAFDAAIEPAPPFSGSGIDWDNVGVHGAGHYSIGGSFGAMGNAHSSCGDPTFFLHHGNMDRLWWLWQLKDSKRLTEIGGKTMQGTTVTLDFKMDLNELTAPWPDLTVREFMNIKGGPLCYDYE